MANLRQWLPTAQSAVACVVAAICSLLATTCQRALMNQSVMETQYSHNLGVRQSPVSAQRPSLTQRPLWPDHGWAYNSQGSDLMSGC